VILTTLVIGATAVARETAILRAIDMQAAEAGAAHRTALILEGLPGGVVPPGSTENDIPFVAHIARIAPSCPCCTGNLTMRVTLNRILRHSPNRLYIGLASDAHLDGIRDFLAGPPYDQLLALTQDLSAEA